MSAAAYALLGTLLGVGLGFVGQYALASRREHAERRLAQDERLYASRSVVYVELLRVRHRQRVTVEGMYPLWSEGPQPNPDPVSLDAAIDLGASADAFGSPAVTEADRLLGKALKDFHFQVRSYEQQAAQTRGQSGIGDRYEDVEIKRVEIRALYESLATAVRRELGTLS